MKQANVFTHTQFPYELSVYGLEGEPLRAELFLYLNNDTSQASNGVKLCCAQMQVSGEARDMKKVRGRKVPNGNRN